MSRLRIGIDLGGTKIEGVVMDARGQLLERERVASPSHSYTEIVEAIASLVLRLQNQVSADQDTPVGVGTPGTWVAQQRLMKNCNSTVLNGQPLLLDLKRLLGTRVRIANDANCFALSEAIDGAGAGAESVFGVILGTGVGGGFVVNGKLLQGASASAGEWGHMPMAYLRHNARDSDNPTTGQHTTAHELSRLRAQLADRTCYCGRLNCVETFLSGPGLKQTAAELLGRPLSAEDLFENAAVDTKSDAAIVQALYCDLLARNLAQVLTLLDPEVVVIGGGLSAQSALYEKLPELLPLYQFNSESTKNRTAEIRPPSHGDSSGVRGAAWLR